MTVSSRRLSPAPDRASLAPVSAWRAAGFSRGRVLAHDRKWSGRRGQSDAGAALLRAVPGRPAPAGAAGDRVGRPVERAGRPGHQLHLDRRGRRRHDHLLRPVGERVRRRHRESAEPLQRRQSRRHADLGRRQRRERRAARRSRATSSTPARSSSSTTRSRRRNLTGDRLRRPRQDRGHQARRRDARRAGRPARTRCSRARSRCSTRTAGAREYRAPVGANIADATDHQMFEYTSLAIMAGEGGATVQIDADANGSVRDDVSLSRGAEPLRERRRQRRRRASSPTTPCRSIILTGDIGSNYESRDSSLLPIEPVDRQLLHAGLDADATRRHRHDRVALQSRRRASITVQYTTRDGGGSLATTPLIGSRRRGGRLPPADHPRRLRRALRDGGQRRSTRSRPPTRPTPSTGGNQAWDWGFTLVPEDSLTPQVLIGLGIGRDPDVGHEPATRTATPSG